MLLIEMLNSLRYDITRRFQLQIFASFLTSVTHDSFALLLKVPTTALAFIHLYAVSTMSIRHLL